jgi:hypothetical protein
MIYFYTKKRLASTLLILFVLLACNLSQAEVDEIRDGRDFYESYMDCREEQLVSGEFGDCPALMSDDPILAQDIREMGWYLLRGDGRRAFRRLRRAGSEWRGLTIHYPTPGHCARLIKPYFIVSVARPLGVVLPPSYAAGWLERAPRMHAWLSRLERALFERARGAALGDHYVLEARRAA